MNTGRRLQALITNDDGFDSAGLSALALRVAAAGVETVVAAPMHESSGSSAAITAVATAGHVTIDQRRLADAAHVTAFAVSGSPALIALIATHDTFGFVPDVVLSGINRGANIGHAVMHSGTVGAAVTAAAAGCHAMAVSLDLPDAQTTHAAHHWSTAAQVCVRLLPQLMRQPTGTVLNVNVPDLPLEQLRGIRIAHLSGFGRVQVTETEPGSGLIRISLEDHPQQVPGSDGTLLAEGYATVTALRSMCEAELPIPLSFSATDYEGASPPWRGSYPPG
jgi:5'/3'-nucleotidase